MHKLGTGWRWVKRWHSRNINSLVPGRCGNNFISLFSDRMSQIAFANISYEIALMWTPQKNFDDKSTLIWEMAWCCQATLLCSISKYRWLNIYVVLCLRKMSPWAHFTCAFSIAIKIWSCKFHFTIVPIFCIHITTIFKQITTIFVQQCCHDLWKNCSDLL